MVELSQVYQNCHGVKREQPLPCGFSPWDLDLAKGDAGRPAEANVKQNRVRRTNDFIACWIATFNE